MPSALGQEGGMAMQPAPGDAVGSNPGRGGARSDPRRTKRHGPFHSADASAPPALHVWRTGTTATSRHRRVVELLVFVVAAAHASTDGPSALLSMEFFARLIGL